MKKITRKNLYELEKEMPVISESEQRDHLGKAVYIALEDGHEYGTIGHELFYVVSMDMYDYAIRNKLEEYGVSLYETNFTGNICTGSEITRKVFTRYASHVIGFKGDIVLVNDPSSMELRYDRNAGSNSGTLYFNVTFSGSLFNRSGLIQKLKSIEKLIEEEEHKAPDPEIIQKKIDEIKAAIAELDREDLKNNPGTKTQQHLREQYAIQLRSLWRDQGHAGFGYEIWDAYAQCGVNGY